MQHKATSSSMSPNAARRLGFETTVYTVNSVARMLELRDLGVAGVFTDDPRAALAALRD